MIEKNLTDRGTHIWSKDAALDRAKEPHAFAEAWREALRKHDHKILEPFLRPGQSSSVFTIRPLEPEEYLNASQLSGLLQNYELVAMGVTDIQNYKVRGETLQPKFVNGPDGRMNARLHRDTMRGIFDQHLLTELAAHIIVISSIDPTLGQG